MKIITVSSLKGGVGKTTLAVFLARALVGMGKRVLTIDLDHNNNLTDYWLRDADCQRLEQTAIQHVLARRLALGAAIMPGVVDIVAATPQLSKIGYELARDPGVAMRLRGALKTLDYDYVIIDTPPSLSLELTIGLYTADMVLVPVSASRWTVQGFQIIADEVLAVSDAIGKAPEIMVVPSMVTTKEADAIQGAGLWKCSGYAVGRDPAVKNAVNTGKALTSDTVSYRAFMGIAGEVV